MRGGGRWGGAGLHNVRYSYAEFTQASLLASRCLLCEYSGKRSCTKKCYRAHIQTLIHMTLDIHCQNRSFTARCAMSHRPQRTSFFD